MNGPRRIRNRGRHWGAAALSSLLVFGCQEEDAGSSDGSGDSAGDTDTGDSADPSASETSDPSDSGDTSSPEPESGLSPGEILTRASLDLRGRRPSVGELDAVAADPASLDGMVASFADDPAFGERIKGMFAGAWRTRIDEYPGLEQDDEESVGPFSDAAGEEPLNLIAYVAMNDLPYTEIVRFTDTFVDPVLLASWPLEEVPAGGDALPPGVVRARYSDGRPLAGVLSMNSVYWRHSSTVENANRGRANALSQALLCQSYLDRPIDFPSDLDLTDSESIQNAIQTQGACQACHSTLDPFASYLWGFMYPDDEPEPNYSVQGERGWQLYTDVPPAFFGQPGERLEDLGNSVAGDERFISCAVRRVYEGMVGRRIDLQDEGALAEHREVFLASGLSLKELARSVATDPTYRGASWTPRFGGDPEPVIRKVAPVDVLAGSLSELSGFALTFDGRPATRLDLGVRTLAGGSDRGDTVNVSTGAVLVQRRLAEGGAMNLVDAAAAGQPGGGRLDVVLGQVDLNAPPTEDTIVALVREGRSRTLDPADPELQALIGVWNDVAMVANPREAWIALVTAVLADPDHLLY